METESRNLKISKERINVVIGLGKIACNADITLWHKRLGHPSNDVLKHMLSIDENERTEITNYEVCAKSKQHRQPFLLSETRSERAFELMRLDMWGPYSETSISGARYMLTIIDDYSRSSWTFLLPRKSQVSVTLRKFFAIIKTHYSMDVKFVRTDNGREFANKDCADLFKGLGIVQQ